jgi:hypothetical protein
MSKKLGEMTLILKISREQVDGSFEYWARIPKYGIHGSGDSPDDAAHDAINDIFEHFGELLMEEHKLSPRLQQELADYENLMEFARNKVNKTTLLELQKKRELLESSLDEIEL